MVFFARSDRYSMIIHKPPIFSYLYITIGFGGEMSIMPQGLSNSASTPSERLISCSSRSF